MDAPRGGWLVLFLAATAWAQRGLVSVTCGPSWLSVAVPVRLMGGRVAAGELILGSGCGVTSADRDGFRLEHPLLACGTTLELLPDRIRYRNILHYHPSSRGLVARARPFSFPVECNYPRTGNISSMPIHPTWIPFGSTVAHRRRPRFALAGGGLLGEAGVQLGLLSARPSLSPAPPEPTPAAPHRPSVPVARGDQRDSGLAVPGPTVALVAMCSVLVAVGAAGCYRSMRRCHTGNGEGGPEGPQVPPGQSRAVAMVTPGSPPAPAEPVTA